MPRAPSAHPGPGTAGVPIPPDAMRFPAPLLYLCAVLVTAACGDSTTPRTPTSLQLDQTAVTLEVGDTVVVSATVLDQHGTAFPQPPAGFTVQWSSSNPSVASVDGGRIVGRGPGQAIITASGAGASSAQIAVTVTAPLLRGRLAFSYSGERTGTFSIDQTFRLTDPNFEMGTWAVTLFDSDFQSQDLVAQRRRPDGNYDILAFWVDGRVTSPGTRNVQAGDGILLFGLNAQTGNAEAVYEVVSGQVTFATVGQHQMAGTFSLLLESATGGVLQVAGGTFDVPILLETDFGAAAAANPAAAGTASGSSPGVWRRGSAGGAGWR
jgi:hypothetical protein